jgi:hypothetical protein
MNNTIVKEGRVSMLQSSYDKHVKGIDFNPTYVLDKVSELPFKDCLIQYDPYGWIDIITFYTDDMTVIINVNLNDLSNCLCDIYHDKCVIGRSVASLEDIIRMLTLNNL